LFASFTATSAESDFSRPFIVGYGSSPSRRDPATQALCLSRSRKRPAFLVADANPFNFAVADRVAKRIKRIRNKAKYVPDANFLQHVDQGTGHCL
jgi:hypothetical protein